MKQYSGWKILLATLVMLVASSPSHAAGDRLLMGMTDESINRHDLVYVRFLGANGEALEFDMLKKMAVRERDCDSGQLFDMGRDYRAGYLPRNLLIGMYLSPYVWKNRTLCFSIPGVGKVEQILDPAASNSRSFQLKLAN